MAESNDTSKLGRFQDWWYEARTEEADNRHEQATDEDFVDGIQYTDEERQILLDRGQSPLVFNEVKPSVEWILGTERRTRVDYKVLPRTDDDRDDATVKTKLLKYLDDVNKAAWVRSQAFAHAVRAGVGWIEVGVRGDAEKEPLFLRAESWRNVWYDPLSIEPDLSDARFVIRSKIVELDLAIQMFPEHEAALRHAAAAREQLGTQAQEDYFESGVYQAQSSVYSYVSDALGATRGRRQLNRLIECWYREPKRVRLMRGAGPLDKQPFDPENAAHVTAAVSGSVVLFDAVSQEIRLATWIDQGELLQDVPSPYRHNRFPLVPVWAYRRGRDNAPYGVVRNVRDPQQDLNKRRSKALFLLSTNRTIMDEGAVDDMDAFEEEVAKPNAIIVKRPNKELRVENNVQIADQHVALAQQSADYVRQSGGVTGDNIGQETNATSGRAILARQNQGSVVTATLYDNLRLAIQLVGEIELSLIEQFYTQEKIVRLTGERGETEFTQVNQRQPDGSILNDITASQADFIVSEQDYRESVRLAMFEQMMQMISQLDSTLAMQLLDLVFEWSDLPGKDEIVRRIRRINGYPDPDDPQAQDKAEQAQRQQQTEQRRQAELERRALEAKTRKDETAAAKAEADTQKVRIDSAVSALQAAIEMLMSPRAVTVSAASIEQASSPPAPVFPQQSISGDQAWPTTPAQQTLQPYPMMPSPMPNSI